MRRLLVLAALLLSLPAGAATRYVAKSGGCSHMSGLTCSAASNCGTTFATACCELQQGHDSSNTASGDTIEVHAGTYQHTGSNEPLNSAWTGNIASAVHVTKANLTIKAATGESATLDLQNTREMGVWLDADGCTVDGLNYINILTGVSTSADHRIGCVTAMRKASGASVLNTTVKNNVCTISSSTAGLSGSVCYRLDTGGTSPAYDNFCYGTFGTGFISMNRPAGSSVVEWHHNTLSGARPANSQTCFILEHYDATALVHHNTCLTSGNTGVNGYADRFMYPRDFNGTIYVYDNYAKSTISGSPYGALYLQDDDDPQSETLYVFNNTFEGYTNGIFWMADSYQAFVRNNIFNTTFAVRYTPCKPSSGCTNTGPGAAGSDFSKNVYSGSLQQVTSGQNSAPATNGANILNAAGCSLLENHHLQSTSTACLDSGFNNPIGQGANVCAFGAISCRLDIDDQVRPVGSGWDIGYDESNPVGAGTLAVCGNGFLEANASCTASSAPYSCCTGSGTGTCETCDDGNTTTETACPYGTPSCTYCNAVCTQVLNLSGPYCGDNILNGPETICDGTNLTGETCVSLGFAGGTLGCAVDCLSFNTNGCSTAAIPKTLSAGTLSGGKIQ